VVNQQDRNLLWQSGFYDSCAIVLLSFCHQPDFGNVLGMTIYIAFVIAAPRLK
jgi:hypothetical protein